MIKSAKSDRPFEMSRTKVGFPAFLPMGRNKSKWFMSAAESVTFAHWKGLDCWSCCWFLKMLDIQQQNVYNPHIYIYIYTCVCVRIFYMFTYVFIFIHTYTYLYVSLRISILTSFFLLLSHFSTYLYIFLHVYTYWLTLLHIHTYVYLCSAISASASPWLHLCIVNWKSPLIIQTSSVACLQLRVYPFSRKICCSPSRCSMPSTTSNKCSSGARIKASKESMSKTKSQSKTSGKEFKYFPGNSTLNFFRGFSKICLGESWKKRFFGLKSLYIVDGWVIDSRVHASMLYKGLKVKLNRLILSGSYTSQACRVSARASSLGMEI